MQPKDTLALDPAMGVIAIGKLREFPAKMLVDVGDAEIEKSATTPMPVVRITCGLSRASSVIVTAPVLVPRMLGVNVTLITQLVVG